VTRAIRRALVLIVLALAVLLLVGDRLTEEATAHAISVEARQSGLLAADPTVTIRGYPFLTQAAKRHFREIDITTHGIHRDGLRIDTVIGRFYGVHVGLVAALDGRIASSPVDHATGELDITLADLDAFLAARHITVSIAGATLTVRGQVVVAGKDVYVTGPLMLAITGGTLSAVPAPASLRGPAGALPAAAERTAAALLAVRVALTELPFGETLQTVTVGPGMLVIATAARGPAVAVPADASQTT
jgi:hypothetical protein